MKRLSAMVLGPSVSPTESTPEATQARDLRQIARFLLWINAVGVAGIVIFALGTCERRIDRILQVAGGSFLFAGTSLLVGSVIGFLFGIPQTLQQARSEARSEDASSQGIEYRVNTNLEQISEWLTKIIVGVGLTQLTHIPGEFKRLGEYLKSLTAVVPCDNTVASPAASVAIAIVIYFLCTGLMAGYLVTRMYLSPAFKRADQTLRERVQAQQKISEDMLAELLYREPPDGFRRAIQMGQRLREQSDDSLSAWFWVYMACAYGQEHAWLQAQPVQDAEAVQRAKANALRAAAKAIQREASIVSYLRELWDPGRFHGQLLDNDLVTFQGDPDFQKLLDPSTSEPPVPA